ncbi:hypothetical protein [Marinomonas primoryensis]|jgi:hypothetical protein|uniref:hypothetical protein n=1 Tax=Marinomonas primoryensis TaxID=178399 RepID=UPI0030DCA48A|tara:strand:- start:3197 stop:3685 length:489 start_codon:yes stop_codon:yes gene_type:complete
MSSSSKSSNTTNNQTTNYSLQGVQGQNVVAGNGNTVTSTDYGSVNAAIGLANSALNSNQIVALSSVDHAGEMAEMAVNATSKAWSGATNLVSEKTADAWSGATKLINDASSANADRVQQMAIAVATDGQNLVAKSNEKNLYIIGGVSVAAVLSMIVMARVKK